MLLFLIIPLALVAVTIAIAPVLALTVLHDREVRAERATPADPVRLPWGMGGTAAVARVSCDDERALARAA